MYVTYAYRTHVGRRPNNEDSLCAEPTLGLFAVADGMGGYEGGEIASRLTVDALKREVARATPDTQSVLDVAVRSAHVDVLRAKQGALSRMGSTIAALLFHGGQAVVAHVGDSRVYRFRDGALTALTRDHSLYAELAEQGASELPPRAEFAYGNVITRALGMDGDIHPDLRRDDVRSGDVYLLCTDGLTEQVGDVEIAEALRQPPIKAAEKLVASAYDRGGKDNITVVVVKVV